MYGHSQLGWNQADHVSVHGELHLLRVHRNGKWQRSYIAARDSAHYHTDWTGEGGKTVSGEYNA